MEEILFIVIVSFFFFRQTKQSSFYCGGKKIETSSLFSNRIGFGKTVNGGFGRECCVVKNLHDTGEDSLRSCAYKENRWITFDVSGEIFLESGIYLNSNTTIDGRNADITLVNRGLYMKNAENVIIHNIKIKDTSDGYDCIGIRQGCHNVWVDHVSMTNSSDELLSITSTNVDARSPQNVTISWSKFSNCKYAMLFGADPVFVNDYEIKVTLHHNFYNGTKDRHPRLRYGKLHAFNNYLFNWYGYGAVSSMTAQIYSERNIFERGDQTKGKKALFGTDYGADTLTGYTKSSEDVIMGDGEVSILEVQPELVFTPSDYYVYSSSIPNEDLRKEIRENAGWQLSENTEDQSNFNFVPLIIGSACFVGLLIVLVFVIVVIIVLFLTFKNKKNDSNSDVSF